MPPKKNNREKRFVLDAKNQLKRLWSAEKGQVLQLTYDYSKSASEDPVFRELVEIAVENFNQLGLASLKYQPNKMGIHLKICPLDVEYIRSKHKNPIIFSKIGALSADANQICATKKIALYDNRFTDFLMGAMVGDNITLPPFAVISCNTAHKNFMHSGIGVILHEINHLFGIQHSHMLENTNGILTVNIAKPKLNDVKRGEMEKFFNIFRYGSFFQAVNYTLASPFSIQHYRIRALEPYRVFNISRIRELLDFYRIPPDMQAVYFYLFEKYAGSPIVYTYQDFATLVSAVYNIAPGSMERYYELPKYFIIIGLYIPTADKIKLAWLLETLYSAEDFQYPILAKETVTLKIRINSQFNINLIEKFKVVKLSKKNLICSLPVENTFFISSNLFLQPDCVLTGQINSLGRFNFNFSILLAGSSVSISRFITLVVQENSKKKNRVLLGQKQVIHYIGENDYTDLLEICQAVALPLGKDLSCKLADNSFVENMHFTHCELRLKAGSKNKNLSFIISNEEANKTCNIQFVFDASLNSFAERSRINLSDEALQRFNEIKMGYYVADKVAYVPQRDDPYLQNQTKQSDSYQVSSSLTMQLNYCLTIPFLHGVLDGVIDSYSCHPYINVGLKLLPRVGLCYFDYLNPLYFALIGFVPFIEGFIKKKLSAELNQSAKNFIHLLLFLVVTELEYGFSNLWQLTDRLCFWPQMTDKFNQLFLQLLFVPLIKLLGYELSVYFIRCFIVATPQEKECIKVVPPLLVNDDSTIKKTQPVTALSCFSAFRVASQSVFSSKILRLFSFFGSAGRGASRQVIEPKGLRVQH